MDGSNEIFIVLPIVAIVILVVLVGLPFWANRGEGRGQAGGRPSLGHQAQDQIPGHSPPADASRSDAIGPGHT
jgi:FtsZ-interacting cell division protein ZipA